MERCRRFVGRVEASCADTHHQKQRWVRPLGRPTHPTIPRRWVSPDSTHPTILRLFRVLVRRGFPALVGIAFSATVAQGAPFAYITNSGDNTVSVIDTATNTVTATVTVGALPFGVAVTPDGARVYVTNFGSDNVSVIDTATNTVTATVTVGGLPFGVAVTPDGARVYVANQDSDNVSVIDTATNTVTATVTVGAAPLAFGQFIGPLPAVTIAEVIALFDQAVADGTLVGQGSGASAQARLNALRNMLVAASDLLEQGDVDAACGQLRDVANRTDGASPPPDLVQGPAAPDLFDAVTALREGLGCGG
jgi:YVTN family beta-propeller protein